MTSIVAKIHKLIPQELPKLRIGSIMRKVNVGLDIGTSMTRISIQGKGIVLREPTFVGINQQNNKTIFFGQEAKDIFGKAPAYIKVVKPFEHSIISDFDATVDLVDEFFKKSVYPYYHNALIRGGITAYSTVPTQSTEVEQKALKEALVKAGASRAFLVDKPLAAASGSDQDIFSNKPVFVIDFGAGIIEAAIISWVESSVHAS